MSIIRKSLAPPETAGTDFNMPVVLDSQLMATTIGMDGKKGAAFGRNTTRPKNPAKT